MFCKKCGSSLSDGTSICQFCGTPQQSNAPTEYETYAVPQQPDAPVEYKTYAMPTVVPPVSPGYPDGPKDTKKNNIGIIAIAIVAIVIVIAVTVVTIVLFGNKHKDQGNSTTTTTTATTITQTEITKPTDDTVTDPITPGTNATDPSVSGPSSSEPSSLPPADFPSTTDPELFGNGPATESTSLVNDVLKPIFSGRKYTMVCVTSTNGNAIPMTVVVDGDDMVFVTSMKEVMSAGGTQISDEEAAMMEQMMGDEIRVVVKDGKSYSLMELFDKKVYMEDNALGMDTSNITNIVSEEMTYVKTTKVQNGGKTYTCEEYKTKNGTVKKFYFLGKQFARMETISNSTTTVIEVTSLSTNVNSSYFSIAGYTKFDANDLGSMIS